MVLETQVWFILDVNLVNEPSKLTVNQMKLEWDQTQLQLAIKFTF